MAVALKARSDTHRHRPWRYRLRQGLWAGLDLLFPPLCAGCRRPGSRLCAACHSSFEALAYPWCERCGYSISQTGICHECQASPTRLTPLAGLRSAVYFSGPLQSALHRFKYQRDIVLADALGEVLAAAPWWSEMPAGELVAVPLSNQRRQERGYNQAALLARAVAERRGQPSTDAIVRRTRHTASQVGLSVAQRRANVQGAFAARREAAGRTFVLLDDVCTTGATLAACAEALMAAGAAMVWGVTLARAARPPATSPQRPGRPR